jgi:hypothetical protein
VFAESEQIHLTIPAKDLMCFGLEESKFGVGESENSN